MLSVYIHIPFCIKRCAYCDFITYAGMLQYLDAYVSTLVKEINLCQRLGQKKLDVKSVYFGGGTPSLLSKENFLTIFNALNHSFSLTPSCEISVEANPGAVSEDKLKFLIDLGMNRFSLGVQSFFDRDLSVLGRIHTVEDVYATYETARRVGIKNVNLDLIFGLPMQTLEDWKLNLNKAVELSPEHLSLYSLILEECTPLAALVAQGKLSLPDEDTAADMFELAMDTLEGAGYEQYEISNWSQGEILRSQHNLQYWRNLPYLGFGAGAHSYIDGYRIENVAGIVEYINLLNQADNIRKFPFSPANLSSTNVDHFTNMQDTMMLGLRMIREGVTEAFFHSKHQESFSMVFESEITELEALGLVERYQNGTIRGLRLTRRGILLGNQVFMRFVGI